MTGFLLYNIINIIVGLPDELKEELTPEHLGALTEAFYNCYGAGKNDKRGD